MKMNKFLLLPACASLLSSAALLQASPLYSVGDNLDVFFDGSSSLRWSSNLFRDDTDEVDDLVWTVKPGFEFNFGRGASNADLVLNTSYEILRYEDNSDVDVELAHVQALGSYESARLLVSGSASFDERQSSSSNSDDVNLDADLARSEVVDAGFDAEYQYSSKFSFGFGVNYNDLKYVEVDAGNFADTEAVTLPFDVFYELTPKLDLSLGYINRETDVEGGSDGDYDKTTEFYNVGLRGDLLPKLSGSLKLGYIDDEQADEGMFGADLDLSYAVSQKLTSSLLLSRDYSVSGTGQTIEKDSVTVRASYAIDAKYSVSGNLGYEQRDYAARDDDQYSLGLRLSYKLDQNWRLGAGYTYSETDSSQAASSYTDHSLSLSASLRY
jgi:maltoporin